MDVLLMYYKQADCFIKPTVSGCWVPVFDGVVALNAKKNHKDIKG